ncbi:hypothetical protein ACFY20_34135 [Streptomyces sp. NPDC001312]|uniref:hypothetical protein n=1 Tax=Streptomyces sp. NPDC001312 TaxID=3364561 RepID=UPI00368DFD42
MTGEAEVSLDDDAAAAHLPATDGEETGAAVRVVLVRRLPASPLVVPLTGGTPMDLRATAGAHSDEVVQSLLDSSLTLDATEDIPPKVIDALRRAAVPPLFRASPWLRRCRPLVLEDGHTLLGGVRVAYRSGRGLWMEPANLTGG